MISGILIFNSSGELVISRFYKSDYSRVAAEAFRVKVVTAKNFSSPVMLLNNYSFLYIRSDDLIIVAMTKQNVNANLVFAFLYQLVDVFKAYFEGSFNQDSIKSNFVLIYELFDEVIDHGYPQIVATELLKQYIHHGSAQEIKGNAIQQINQTLQITSGITGKTPWREEGKYNYPKNEVYLDVIEQVNIIINQQGKQLSSYCIGRICMKSTLSGMPECRFGLNDKVSMQQRHKARGSSKHVSTKESIELEDMRFHKCVQLHKFDQDKTILFIPPDGEFELMSYRINKTQLPFDVSATVQEHGRNRVEYLVRLKARYEAYNVGQDITVNIPVPTNTSKVGLKCTIGKYVYEPSKHCVVWHINKLAGGISCTIKGEVTLTHLIVDKQWAKPPITFQFTIPMWPASGLKVRFLNVQEPKLNYKSIKWVRYITNAGDYQIRI